MQRLDKQQVDVGIASLAFAERLGWQCGAQLVLPVPFHFAHHQLVNGSCALAQVGNLFYLGILQLAGQGTVVVKMQAQVVGIEDHLVDLLPRLGIVHRIHAWQTVVLQFGGDACTVVLSAPHIVVLRHAYEVAAYVDVVVGVDGQGLCQRVAV